MRSSCLSASTSNVERVERSVNDGSINLTDRFVDSEGIDERSVFDAMLWSLLRDDRRTVAVRLVLDEEVRFVAFV